MPLALPEGGAGEGGSNPVIIANPPGAPPVYGNPWESPSYTAPNPIISGLPVYTPPPIASPIAPPLPPTIDPNGPEVRAWVAANPTAPISFGYTPPQFTTVSTPAPPTQDEFEAMIQNDPYLKQAQEWNQADYNLALQRAQEDRAFYEEGYQLAKKAVSSSGGSGAGAALAAYAELDRIAKEKAAHDLANQQEAIRESMGGRGGQAAWASQEAQYQYDTLIKEIDAQAAARRASAASASGAAARARTQQLAQMELDYREAMVKFNRIEEDLRNGLARANGEAYMASWDRLSKMYWNEETGAYIGPPSPSGATSTVTTQTDPYAGIFQNYNPSAPITVDPTRIF
jgi:hypothetical protein